MPLTRFSISLDADLLQRFDLKLRSDGCPTRSKAVADLVRAALVETEWREGREVAGALLLVYDHHKRDLAARLTEIQHDFIDLIVSTQHIHLDHDNCMEIIAVRGKAAGIAALARRLKAVKGLKHTSVAATSTGARLH